MNREELNYMFRGNLETIKRMIDELIEMDQMQVDQILKNGHEWAVDHIASSSDDIQEVYNFLKNHDSSQMNNRFAKTFESFTTQK
jgi:predicted transcriptional regulator